MQQFMAIIHQVFATIHEAISFTYAADDAKLLMIIQDLLNNAG